MTPILGILASGISGNLWAPGKDFDSIATTTVGAGGVVSVTLSSIPSTYRHLQVRWFSRNLDTSTTAQLTFNGDNGSNYTSHYLFGNGASVGAGASVSSTYITGFDQPSSASAASIFGAGVIDILDYTNTNKLKTSRFLGGNDQNGSGVIALGSGLWNSTTAITSITFKSQGGSGFAQYSQFALYGVK